MLHRRKLVIYRMATGFRFVFLAMLHLILRLPVTAVKQEYSILLQKRIQLFFHEIPALGQDS